MLSLLLVCDTGGGGGGGPLHDFSGGGALRKRTDMDQALASGAGECAFLCARVCVCVCVSVCVCVCDSLSLLQLVTWCF